MASVCEGDWGGAGVDIQKMFWSFVCVCSGGTRASRLTGKEMSVTGPERQQKRVLSQAWLYMPVIFYVHWYLACVYVL